MGKLFLYFVINFLILLKLLSASDVRLEIIENGVRCDPSEASIVGINLAPVDESAISSSIFDKDQQLNDLLLCIRRISGLDELIIGMRDHDTPIISLNKNSLKKWFGKVNLFLKTYKKSIVVLDISDFVDRSGKLSIRSKDLPINLKHLVLKDPGKRVKKITSNFLKDTKLE